MLLRTITIGEFIEQQSLQNGAVSVANHFLLKGLGSRRYSSSSRFSWHLPVVH
jgi:hypothetical protein